MKNPSVVRNARRLVFSLFELMFVWKFFMKMNLLLESFNCLLGMRFSRFCLVKRFICIEKVDYRPSRISVINKVEFMFCATVQMISGPY